MVITLLMSSDLLFILVTISLMQQASRVCSSQYLQRFHLSTSYAIGAHAGEFLATQTTLMECYGPLSFVSFIVSNNMTLALVINSICHADMKIMERPDLTKSPPSKHLAIARVKWV